MDIEQEILNKVGKGLLVGTLIVVLVCTAGFLGMKQWFWHQVDQEVYYQLDKLGHTTFGDIVSRSEVRVISVWLWTAKIDILVVRLSENNITVYVNVSSRGENTATHSYHAHATTPDGITAVWSSWVKDSDGAD